MEFAALVKALPGAAKAVARIVGATGDAFSDVIDIASAWGQQRAQAIRDQTTAHSALSRALTQLQIGAAGQDDKFVTRALSNFSNQFLRFQESREDITVLALENLRTNHGSGSITETPTDDWLDAFSRYAEVASDGALRANWAAILAGEIRSPGSISLLTLRMMSVIDRATADLLVKYMPLVAVSGDDYGIVNPNTFDSRDNVPFDDLLRLDEVGFLQVGGFGMSGSPLMIGHYEITTLAPQNISIPCVILTRAGKDLFNIIRPEVGIEYIARFKQQILGDYPQASFEVVDVRDRSSVTI